MGCIVAVLALMTPRLAIVLVVIFSDFIGDAYQTWVWPLLGFVFLPLTTLAYAAAVNWNDGSVSGGYFFMVLVAALFDLGAIGGGHRARHRREQLDR